MCFLDGSYPTTNALCEIARVMQIMAIESRSCCIVCSLFLSPFYHASGGVSKFGATKKPVFYGSGTLEHRQRGYRSDLA